MSLSSTPANVWAAAETCAVAVGWHVISCCGLRRHVDVPLSRSPPRPLQAAQQAQGGSPWQVHYTAEGRPYFYNAQTGVTQWNAPA